MRKPILIVPLLFIFIISSVSAVTTYRVSSGNDDFTVSQPDGGSFTYDYTSTTIIAEKNSVVTPSMTRLAYMNIDTSGIDDDYDIIDATLYFYANSYTASKGITKNYNIWMFNGATWSVIKSGTFVSAGWVSEVLTSTELDYINKVGTTNFLISVDSAGVGKSRSFQVRALEYSGTYEAYMEISAEPPEPDCIERTIWSLTNLEWVKVC